jgi:dephospho-CoA kinase
LTGAIAAGKSEALAAFERQGAATLSSDAVAHDMLAGEEMRSKLVERWGEEVAPGGEVDRARIAEIVFEQPGELRWLESELHPRVGAEVASWGAALAPGRIGVIEVPLLFETSMEDAFDAVVCVVADDEVRRERAAARGQAGLQEREQRQLSQDEKASRADHVISNDGTVAELEDEVRALIQRLSAPGQ